MTESSIGAKALHTPLLSHLAARESAHFFFIPGSGREK